MFVRSRRTVTFPEITKGFARDDEQDLGTCTKHACYRSRDFGYADTLAIANGKFGGGQAQLGSTAKAA
jgi:hypothetical protein